MGTESPLFCTHSPTVGWAGVGVGPITGVSPPLGWAGRGLHHRGESSAGLGWAWSPSQG